MQVELKDFTVHLGSHDFGIEGMYMPGNQDHKLSEPSEGVEGLRLPFITFPAKDTEAANQFVQQVNRLAVRYSIDADDIANLISAVDNLIG